MNKCEECNVREAAVKDGSYKSENRWCPICWSNLNYIDLIDNSMDEIADLLKECKKDSSDVKKVKEHIKEVQRLYRILRKHRQDIIKR